MYRGDAVLARWEARAGLFLGGMAAGFCAAVFLITWLVAYRYPPFLREADERVQKISRPHGNRPK